MRRGLSPIAIAIVGAVLTLTACGKAKTPTVDAATEQKEAMDRARKDVFGTQVQALDKAKAMQEDINKKASDNLDKADAMSK